MNKHNLPLLLLFFCSFLQVSAQNRYELNTGWLCRQASLMQMNGEQISTPLIALPGWKPAVVPGTVLTTQLANGDIPDPFYGMNNKAIPDIYNTGKAAYTYWFVKDFVESQPLGDEQVFLYFRGVNYSFDVFLNGKKINDQPHKGMFLSKTYNITAAMVTGNNRLAVIVYPPDVVGNANGGQGGDGTIARNVTNQYVAGWDWIQPIHDRNTGIWDKVLIEKTKQVNVKNVHVVTLVPGVRKPAGSQAPATLKLSAELENVANKPVAGKLSYELDGKTISRQVTLAPHSVTETALPDVTLDNPRLWWPNTYGPQNLYAVNVLFTISDSVISDSEHVSFGVREIQTEWNHITQSKQVKVNGQKIFIKGGNWIVSDAMLRFSDARYDAEVRFHKDMNLNLLRIWGGAITERPEFYKACDKYGILVMQDFWISGDCNGPLDRPGQTGRPVDTPGIPR